MIRCQNGSAQDLTRHWAVGGEFYKHRQGIHSVPSTLPCPRLGLASPLLAPFGKRWCWLVLSKSWPRLALKKKKDLCNPVDWKIGGSVRPGTWESCTQFRGLQALAVDLQTHIFIYLYIYMYIYKHTCFDLRSLLPVLWGLMEFSSYRSKGICICIYIYTYIYICVRSYVYIHIHRAQQPDQQQRQPHRKQTAPQPK